MSDGFVHSVRVPRLYKVTAKTVQTVVEDGASLKELVYAKKHPNIAATYALALTAIKNGPKLDHILRKTQLLFKEPRLDPWMARVLITEMILRNKTLASQAKPILTILSYEKQLREADESYNANQVDPSAKDRDRKPRYVRLNTLVTSIEESIANFKDEGWTLLPKSRDYASYLKVLSSKLNESNFVQDFHIPELFVFPPDTRFFDHPDYQRGAIILQDKASCFPAFLLNPPPEATIVDMCAAPGMKTTHLAAIMNNTGKIFAVEKDLRRYMTLCNLVKQNSAACVRPIHADAMTLDPKNYPGVEYILVDPSCSGSGMLDRISLGSSDSKIAPGRLTNLQSFQVLLLRHALLNFPTVKRVVYSTCSVHPEENEMVVDEILTNVGDSYKLVSVKKLLGSNWKNFSSKEYKCKDKCLYSRPEDDFTNGFFVAVFERNFDVELPEYKRTTPATKRALNDKSNVSKDEGDDDQVEDGKKKRRRKFAWKAPGYDAETAEVKVPLSEESSGKRQKKKHKRALEPAETDENGQEKRTVKTEETQKKSEKKKKRTAPEVMETVIEAVDTSPIEDETFKKKKKRKKLSESEVIEEVAEITEIQAEKTKKKKKKLSESEAKQEVVDVTETSNEEKIKKKKKKLSESEVTQEVIGTTDTPEGEKTKKKKKKTKKQPDSEEPEVLLEILPVKSKKATKKKIENSQL